MILASDRKMEGTLPKAYNLSYILPKAQGKLARKNGDIAHEIEECRI